MKIKASRLIATLIFCVIMGSLSYSQQTQVLQTRDNSNWDDRFNTQGLNGSVTGLAVYGGNVYAGGTFTNTIAGTTPLGRIARWDGSTWSPLGSGVNNRVRDIAVHLDKVYVGGSFTTAGGISANRVAVWNGSGWSALGSGVDGDVYAIAVDGNQVYVGGDFQYAGGVEVNNIAVYNTTTQTWSALDNGIVFSGKSCYLPYGINTGWDDAIVYDILIRGELIFVGGGFNKAGSDSANNVAYWDGSSWHSMGDGITEKNLDCQPQYILSLTTDWQHIYAGTSDDWTYHNVLDGFVHFAYVYKWSSGMGWSSQGDATLGSFGEPKIHALDFTSGMLFAGGEFSQDTVIWDTGLVNSLLPSLRGNNIIFRKDGSDWDSLGSGTNGSVFEIVARPSEVWVGGTFSKAGNKASHNIARYVLDSFPDLTCIYVPADYPTIQEAIDVATDGDTIMVASGNYEINSAIVNNRVNNLKIYGSRKEDGSDASLVNASVNPGEHFCFSFQNVAGCEISGFEIKNGVVGVFYTDCISCKCSSNYIHHQHKISGINNPSGISICSSTMIVVQFCILDSNEVKGIEIWQGENINIINNTIVNNSDKCGCMISNSDSITVKNNILACNNTHGIGVNNCTSTEFVHDYNCFYNNSTAAIEGYSPGAHSISADPLFVDLTGGDYYLQSGSPCLGAGEEGKNIGALGVTASETVIYQDDFNDNIISDTTWQIIETTGTSIAEQNQRLEMQTTVIGDAKVKSKFMLQGDFDLRIDFKVSPNEVNGNGLGITVFDEDSSYSINRLYDAGWPTRDGKNGHMYMSNFSGDYSYEGRLSTPADDTTGTLRLTRTGSTVTSYFERENQWIELKSKTGTTEDLYLSIYVMVYGTLMPLQGWADNFTITKGTLEWPEVDAIPESPSQKVTEFRLFQNHPNPFNATTQISYSIPACSRVSLTIYNLRGEEVATLFEGYQNPGTHTVKWDACYSNGHPVSSGVYFYRLKTDNYVTTRKLLLMK